MGYIIDLSKWNDNIDWDVAAPQLDLAICRVQYGSNKKDTLYDAHVTNLEAKGIRHAAYAYGCYESVNDAIVEAKDFLARVHPNAKFLVLDVEDDTLKAMKDENKLAEASQAFIQTCRKAGWKIGLYVSHHMYDSHGLQNVDADFLWLPRYGTNDGKPQKKPSYSCDIWQYTDNGYINGIGKVDMNLLQGNKKLDWYVGEQAKYIATGGLGLKACTEISQYLLERRWWAIMEFTTNGDAFVKTGGICEPNLSEFREWMDQKGWWYEVKE
ncbi:N-acetylmuramoyl-L-alanine amidase (plasmid) [Bacillus sp. JAS24-2]|uniref:GH25 family lysozyme n=1 Tax=Bacillus sp. JAS24-2 TaxID=2217832 RepID=UPI0011EE27EA|nr:GH25 family lysozyme [Bacillus sp. JAS24-2]QEL82857.1 N-acetylmuramoyl-L-alanine amidase [Bacillus sp. JAS24-2]